MLQQIGAEPQATWRLVAILIAIGPALVVYNWLFDYMIQYNLGDKGIDVVGCGCILVAHVPYLDIDDVFERKDFKDYRFWKTTSLGMRFGTAHLTLAVYKDFCCYKKLSPRNPADFKALLLKKIDDAHVQISGKKT